jgi:predicted outer membrane repeat protein
MAIVFCDVAATGLNNGTSWEDAYTSLQTAVTNANNNDDVWVKEGTYNESTTVTLWDTRDVYGGFNSSLTGTSGSVGTRDYWVDQTIVTGARANLNCILTIENSIFENNYANVDGGAIYATYGTVATITDCSFINNHADDDGGAIYVLQPSTAVEVYDSWFDTNSCVDNGGCIFGGNNASIDIYRCKFHDNIAITGDGGAVWTWAFGGAIIQDSLFDQNESTAGYGGAIYKSAPGGTLSVVNCTFTLNRVWSTSSSAIDGGATVEVINGISWNNNTISGAISAGTIVTYSNVEGGFTGTGNLSTDPLFIGSGVDPIDPYQIGAGSPCIDSANGGPASAMDILHNPRYDDPATSNTGIGTPPYVDRGCYEYQGAVVTGYAVDLGINF